MSFNPYWKPPPGRGPTWKTVEELHEILKLVRQWYSDGASDLEISYRIRQKWPPPAPFRRLSKPR